MAWILPFIGAFLVLHLIGQSDRAAIPEWIPDPAINRYVFELLGIEGKVAERAAEHVELAQMETFNCARYRLTIGKTEEWLAKGRPT